MWSAHISSETRINGYHYPQKGLRIPQNARRLGETQGSCLRVQLPDTGQLLQACCGQPGQGYEGPNAKMLRRGKLSH